MKKIIVPILIGILLICLCVSILGGVFFVQQNSVLKKMIIPTDTTPTSIFSQPDIKTDTPQQTPEVTIGQVEAGTDETLNTLRNTIVPENDYRILAEELKGIKNIPEAETNPPKNFNIGDTESFWVSQDDTHANYKVQAVLRYKGDHVYFWVDQQSQYEQSALDNLAKTFDEKIYPTDRAFFGSEWSPGIDNDPHLYILLAHGVGNRIAGYFSARDEIPVLASPYSNAHEMFVINSDVGQLNDEFTYGVLAHEFQHMIHWNRDRNDASWLNEGFSELAALLNGYFAGGFDFTYVNNPDLQLNDWPNDPQSTSPHYGAGFLFLDYFLNRFGKDSTQALVGDKANGMDKVDDVLQKLAIKDPQNGQLIKADDFFADWAVTNILLDPNVGDGRYQYQNYQTAPKANATTAITECPVDPTEFMVHQYGVDYIDISCNGDFSLNFQGSTEAQLLPAEPHSGKYAFWSNKGDDSDMTLTHEFDLSQIHGSTVINYWTWYDLEKDFDYVYLEESEDGQNWTIIKTPSGTDKNPSGGSYGWGYNGTSPGWVEESVDLAAYQGKKIQLRFEYITDDAVNGEGFLLDDVSFPAINYATDFETDDGGWIPGGFVRVQNRLPQTYILSIIKQGAGKTTVDRIVLDDKQSANIPLHLGNDIQHATLVISGATRFTRTEAPYKISITQ